MNLIRLNICRINSVIKIDCNKRFRQILNKRYHGFLTPLNSKPLDFVLSLKTFPFRRNNFLNTNPRVLSEKNGWLIKGLGFRCNISNKAPFPSGSGTCREDVYVFDSLLRVLWTQLLLMKNGFLVHACGIRNGTGAYLFPGPSSSGKTTLAKKVDRKDILSDELVGLKVENGKSILMGTPFWGEFRQGGLAATRHIQGIYFLKPHNKLRISKVSIATALRKMLKLVLFFNNDPQSGKKLLHLITRCVCNTLCYNLYLPKKIPYRAIINALDKAK